MTKKEKLAELKKKILLNLLNLKEIKIQETITLTNGRESFFYIDIKKTYGYPDLLKLYVEYIKLAIEDFSVVIGSGYGGVPLATAVSLRSKRSNVLQSMIRKYPKNHGKPSIIDGYPFDGEKNNKKKYLVVDDVFTTGKNLQALIKIIKKNCKTPTLQIFVICNRSGKKNPNVDGVEVKYIFTPEELENIKLSS